MKISGEKCNGHACLHMSKSAFCVVHDKDI